MVTEKEGFYLVRDQATKYFLERTELTRRVQDCEETRKRNATAILDLQGKKSEAGERTVPERGSDSQYLE